MSTARSPTSMGPMAPLLAALAHCPQDAHASLYTMSDAWRRRNAPPFDCRPGAGGKYCPKPDPIDPSLQRMRMVRIPAYYFVSSQFSQTTTSPCPCRYEKSLRPVSSRLEAKRHATGRRKNASGDRSRAPDGHRDGASIVELPHHRLWRDGSPREKARRPWVVNLDALQRGDVRCWESMRAAKGSAPAGRAG